LHGQEYINELELVHFCTPDDALVVGNILSFLYILSQVVKPPSDTLLRYCDMFHLAPSPSSLLPTSLSFVLCIAAFPVHPFDLGILVLSPSLPSALHGLSAILYKNYMNTQVKFSSVFYGLDDTLVLRNSLKTFFGVTLVSQNKIKVLTLEYVLQLLCFIL
jgi:hypothetical protein